ncbi:hypothetical protein KCM76_23720 [Zooshikella marina]|uniref:hypothetical protein n=1 Tax=Zooshikella ganghwensis TaxID=202772 RepID=UPI001BAFEB9B|nr:hypothetical protein [Zooshikella ganghwensis]MBU2709025.1 hypothetical protein [Zooshikella ganghwensis]
MNVNEWADKLAIEVPNDSWVVGFRISTVPIENWFYKRNRLVGDSIKLDLNIPAEGCWVATLERHDKLFQVQWRPSNDVRVESQQIKYKKIIKWPTLGDIYEFPALVKQLESILNIEFKPHIDMSSRLVSVDELVENQQIKNWLSKWSNSIGHSGK